MAREGVTSSGLMVALLLGSLSFCAGQFNITQVLAPFPDYSQLNDWLSRTGVADEINNRTTITVLAPSNSLFGAYLSTVPNAYTDLQTVGDTLRYHVLLGYFGIPQLEELPANGTSVTTLLQTTGRANESQGFVTLYNNGTEFLVGHQFPDSYGNATILSNITQSIYVYSVLQISSILTPVTPSLPSPSPAPSPLSNISSPISAPPTVPIAPVDGPASSAETTSPGGSHGSTNSASKLVLLLGMLLAYGVALL